MAPKLERGTAESREPYFDGESGQFRQDFTFRAPCKIAPGAVKQIVESIAAQYRRTIELNKITVFQWPPLYVAVDPHGDMQGFELTFGTSAQLPTMTVIHTAPPATKH